MTFNYRFKVSDTDAVVIFKGETFREVLRKATDFAFKHHLLLIW